MLYERQIYNTYLIGVKNEEYHNNVMSNYLNACGANSTCNLNAMN